MPDETYGPKVYSKQGGDEIVVASGGKITVETGGKIYGNPVIITEGFQGAIAATAANYGLFYIAPCACQVVSVREVHTAAGTDAGAVSLDIEKLTGTQALDEGVSVLAAVINLKGAINTVQSPAVSETLASLKLAVGDRLALKDAGVLTAVAGVQVTVEVKPI